MAREINKLNQTGPYSEDRWGPPVREYTINAISVPIVYNKYGDHDKNGMMYVLEENESALQQQIKRNGLTPSSLVQPLVIRANLGDKVRVRFHNKLSAHASIHIQKTYYEVEKSDGSSAGENRDTTIAPGESITYLWDADCLGTCYFGDMGNFRATEKGSNVHGLWGALIVEEPGSIWTDPETGDPLPSGQMADIHHPIKPDFREYVLFLQDELEILDKDGKHPVSPLTGLADHTMGFNYRSEPMRHRNIIDPEKKLLGENVMMSSWVYGDPATPLLRAYRGDPAKIRLVHGGIKETHVFHLHVHQWRLESRDEASVPIDSISISPQETYDIEVEGGGGSMHGAMGDVIWHCHLYPHFADAGMWGLWRVHDRLEDGSKDRVLPDGTRIKALKPLPDRTPPPAPDERHPGFPFFIPGTLGHRAPKPPLSITGSGYREPTDLEKANFVDNYKPAALYVNPVPDDAPVRRFDVAAIQRDIVYNKLGWHDPQGRIYVLEEDVEKVLTGEKKPEPLFIRANVGDVIELNLRNALPETLGGTAFQNVHQTISVGCHVHLVKFDPISSDGGMNGWNYDSSADTGDTMTVRWYADTELKTVFFHDHLFANMHQQHGIFNALIVEPPNAGYLNPQDGLPIASGSQAVIKTSGAQPSYREFCLAVHDFALLYDKEGNPLNPPPVPDSQDDPGVMGINLTSEPFEARKKGDPAYVFSSWLHGDPWTPVLKCYAGDLVRVRLIDGAHEEQHTFNIHGIHWHKEIGHKNSPLISSQNMGISEAFNIEFTVPDVKDDTDFLYYFGGLDDLWLGLWGIIRVYAQKVDDLIHLPGRPEPPARTKSLPECIGEAPPLAKKGGMTPPPGAPAKIFDVAAIKKRLVYNKSGDHDPEGLIFVLAADKEKVLKGRKRPEPLVIRANAGDYLVVNLENCLPEKLPMLEHEPGVPVEIPWTPSSRVSLAAGLTSCDFFNSGGIAVGFNADSTVAPGKKITYHWYANVGEGGALLSSWGDVRYHRHHGLFGGLIIEPLGSVYRHPVTGRRVNSGTAVDILCPTVKDYREFVVFLHNGVRLVDRHGQIIPDFPFQGGHEEEEEHGEHEDREDFEDQGQKGINYRNEPYRHRLLRDNRVHKVFDTDIHGTPATPVFSAYSHDKVVFRVIMAADKPRNHCFTIHGHCWQVQPDNPLSSMIDNQGGLGVGSVYNLVIPSAGGRFGIPGSYLYRSGILLPDMELGVWGIFQVLDESCNCICCLRNGLKSLTD